MDRGRFSIGLHALLFVLTFAATLFAGAINAGANPIRNPADLLRGLSFAVPLMAILGVHETGHYVAARRHRVEVTPPYFIPAPSLIGTFGAFIRIKSPVPHRNALMDIGAAGPIAGALVAIPVLLLGLKMSVVRSSTGVTGALLGESLLFRTAAYAVLGKIPDGFDVVLHPAAFAGWIGLLVTALNLIPAGQLDGGHIAYALFGAGYERISRLVPFLMLPMGLLWAGWFIWSFLLLVLGTRHPRPVFDEIPLSPGRRGVGIAAALLFLLCFTPDPFSLSM